MSRLLDTIRMAIYESRMTIQEICKKTGLSKNTVSSLKQGSKSNVGTPLLSTVLEVLDAIGYYMTISVSDTDAVENVKFPLRGMKFIQKNYNQGPTAYSLMVDEADLDYETNKRIINKDDKNILLRTLIILTNAANATVSVVKG